VADDDGAAREHEEERPVRPTRMACPFCGSSRTQPFTHAGPAARQNMRCLDCGHQFKDPNLKR
jgi:transposase-like protein